MEKALTLCSIGIIALFGAISTGAHSLSASEKGSVVGAITCPCKVTHTEPNGCGPDCANGPKDTCKVEEGNDECVFFSGTQCSDPLTCGFGSTCSSNVHG